MDTFIEQIVTKLPNTKDTILKLLIGFLAILVGAGAFILSGAFGMVAVGVLLAGGAIYGGFYLISGFDVEYEYIVTNGEIDIDKIIARRRRKRLLTAKISAFEKFGPIKSADILSKRTLVLAGSGSAEDDYYADFSHPKLGAVRLVFSPNEKVLESLKPYISRNVRNLMA